MNNTLSIMENIENHYPSISHKSEKIPLKPTNMNTLNLKSPVKQQILTNSTNSPLSLSKKRGTSPHTPSLHQNKIRKRIEAASVPPKLTYDLKSQQLLIDSNIFGKTSNEIQLNYQIWLLNKQLQQSNELNEFLQLEREFEMES
ncbi:unnamed protein product [Candida verbasci]|uniref:Uncharacterized protein n=1 Tax=Candida verbasci TaxID=1227364 RepID=A0A9W4TUK5_9ASCO|nr:unnamed protein product [Candida verbasci]